MKRNQLLYWYQGARRTQRNLPCVCACIFILAPSAALTVSLTLCIRFCALPSNISVASLSSSEPIHTNTNYYWALTLTSQQSNNCFLFSLTFLFSFFLQCKQSKKHFNMYSNKIGQQTKQIFLPCAPNMVAFTVLKIFNCVAIVGIRSQTCNKFVRILLSVHSRANCFAMRVTSALASAIALAVAISSLLLPLSSLWTSSERRAINSAILRAAAINSLSFADHWRTSRCRLWAAT